MKTIKVPENINLNMANGPIEVDFSRYVRTNPLSDAKFGTGYASLIILNKLRFEALSLLPGDGWHLEDDAYMLLKSAVDFPSKTYDIEMALAFLPFMTAIMEATDNNSSNQKVNVVAKGYAGFEKPTSEETK